MNNRPTSKAARRAAELASHYNALAGLYTLATGHPADEAKGKKMSVALLKIEQKAGRRFTDYCNTGSGDLDSIYNETEAAVVAVFGGTAPRGLKINGDPRGYALKISDDVMRETGAPDLQRDFGGYGLLSPTIDGN